MDRPYTTIDLGDDGISRVEFRNGDQGGYHCWEMMLYLKNPEHPNEHNWDNRVATIVIGGACCQGDEPLLLIKEAIEKALLEAKTGG